MIFWVWFFFLVDSRLTSATIIWLQGTFIGPQWKGGNKWGLWRWGKLTRQVDWKGNPSHVCQFSVSLPLTFRMTNLMLFLGKCWHKLSQLERWGGYTKGEIMTLLWALPSHIANTVPSQAWIFWLWSQTLGNGCLKGDRATTVCSGYYLASVKLSSTSMPAGQLP